MEANTGIKNKILPNPPRPYVVVSIPSKSTNSPAHRARDKGRVRTGGEKEWKQELTKQGSPGGRCWEWPQ